MRYRLMKVLVLACSLFWGQSIAAQDRQPDAALPTEQQSELTFLHSNGLNWTPIDLSAGLILFEANLNGEKVWALLDNGADSTFVDSNSARELGIGTTQTQNTIRTAFGSLKSLLTDQINLKIPGQFTVDARFNAIDLSSLSDATGKKVSIIFGSDIINTFSYLIDFEKKRMFVVPSGSVNFDKFKKTTIALKDGALSGNVNGRDATMRIDLGSNNLLIISETRWDFFFPDSKLEALGQRIDAAGNLNRSTGTRDMPIRVAGQQLNSDVKQGTDIAKNVDGYLGVPFFQGKAAYFDYPNERILLFTGQ